MGKKKSYANQKSATPMALPSSYLERMRELLGETYDDFLRSYDAPATHGLHGNLYRISARALDGLLRDGDCPWRARPIPGIPGGYQYEAGENPGIGHTVLHHAGLCYAQDPAAMLPAAMLCHLLRTRTASAKGLRVLDLCAAPGGKSSQLAQYLGDEGILIANEPHPERCRILMQNMERMGYRNVLVTSSSPEELANAYASYFDCILVDAPCSGEGMFRKDPAAIGEWNEAQVVRCALRQRDILDHAVRMLRPGGLLAYATCTYAAQEDEAQVQYLTDAYGLRPLRLQDVPEVAEALLGLCETAPGCYRCYPHLRPGEGQFMSFLAADADSGVTHAEAPSTPSPARDVTQLLEGHPSGLSSVSSHALDMARAALQDCFDFGQLALTQRGDALYILPAAADRLPPRALTLPGVCLGSLMTKGRERRFYPHHQLFRAYPERFFHRVCLDLSDRAVGAYLGGAELDSRSIGCGEDWHGYAALCVLGAGLGGLRLSGGRCKNLYPKGLRER